MPARARVTGSIPFVVVLGACDWAQYGFDATHAGFNPIESGITIENAKTLTPRWTSPMLKQQPVVASGSVFALHLVTGGGIDLVALNPANGAIRWHSAATSGEITGPAISGNTVYAAFANMPAPQTWSLHGYDTATGPLRWATPGSTTPVQCQSPEFLASPTVGAGVVVFTNFSGSVCAFDAATGAFKWSRAMGEPVSEPPIAGGRLFVFRASPPGSTTIDALDARTGAVIWSRTLPNSFPEGTPIVLADRLLVPADRLRTFDVATGAPGWTSASGEVSGGGGSLVQIASRTIRGLDPNTGAERWSIVGPVETNYSKPAIANGVVYVGSYQEFGDPRVGEGCCAHVSALRLDTGGLLFSFSTQTVVNARIPTSAIVSNGTVYAVAFGVTALRPSGS